MSEEATPAKRGRPPMTPEQKQAARASKIDATRTPLPQDTTTSKWGNLKAKPNWESIDPNRESTPDQYHIARDDWPEGYALQWVVDSVLGQDMGQQRSGFEQGGWTPMHQSDFEGRFNGRFMVRDKEGEIVLGGQVLMYRPIEFSEKAQRAEYRRAREQMEIKERALRGGEMPNVTLDSQHKSALQTNKISRSYERIDVPKD